MSFSPWTYCLWPGLARAWRGEARGLLRAVGFGAALNLLLLTQIAGWFPISGWIAGPAWAVLATAWLAEAIQTRRRLPEILGLVVPAPREELFRQAQVEMLQGHGFESERALRRLLRTWPRDAEARLLLATLHRRAGRLDDSAKELARLERLDGATRWWWEIRQEKRLLREAAETEVAEEPSPDEPAAVVIELPAPPDSGSPRSKAA